MGNKHNRVKKSKCRPRMKRLLILRNLAQQRRQKNILRKPKPRPKPEPVDEPESEVKRAAKSQSIEVTGPRSCRLQKCVFSGCPNSAPAPAQQNDGITYYFPFPVHSKQFRTWARHVARANRDKFWPRLTSRVCQLHFPPELISADGRGGAALARGAVPSAEPYRNVTSDIIFEVIDEGEIPNTEEVGDINEQVESHNYSKDLVINLEIDDKNPEVKQAVATPVDVPPPENEIQLQCVNVENNNTTVYYLSVDKDNTVNHTHTVQYLSDNNNTDNHTLMCSSLNEDQISSYEAVVSPNITQTRIMNFEIVPNQNDRENNFGVKSKTKLVGGENITPDKEVDETIQNTESDNLDTDITVISDDCSSDGETEETATGEADTSAGIRTGGFYYDENVVIVVDSDSDNGLEPET